MFEGGCALAVVPFVAWAACRILGLERGWPVVQLMAWTPYAAVAGVLVSGAVLLCRRWIAGAVGAVAALALVAVVVPRVLPDGGPLPDGPALRVLSANLFAGRGDEGAVLALARRLRVDVLAVQELSETDAAALDAAGIARDLPHRAWYPMDGAGGSAIFSRFPLREVSLRTDGFPQAHAVADVPGAPPVELESVHPNAPVERGSMPLWHHDLAHQPKATPAGVVRILVGDFNSTLDHVTLRRLIGTGYRDAAEVAGTGLRSTWPADGRLMPGVTLDRVLADRRVGVRAARPYRIPGTDHRAFYADLVLPAPTSAAIASTT
ncbi:endonuclease [Virgisporangium aurantiacum]|uniref:Endonuclease n=1 Tax=Virgisporangium aurantiacum TaxID=175570 RepID=A0A8J3Z1L5_9ACTN|nr:endonuclease [Virgisporangium aurantiacum]